MRALIFVYIMKEFAHTHAQDTPLEWFLSTPGQGVMPRLLSETCWLQHRVYDITAGCVSSDRHSCKPRNNGNYQLLTDDNMISNELQLSILFLEEQPTGGSYKC